MIALIKKTIFKLITCNVSTSILKLELTIYVIAIVDQMKQFLIQSNVRAKIVCGARSDQKKHIPYQIITALFCRSTKAGLLDGVRLVQATQGCQITNALLSSVGICWMLIQSNLDNATLVYRIP